MSANKQAKITVVLRLMLDRPRNLSADKLAKLLDRVGYACDRCRNATMRAWELDARQNDWQAPVQCNKAGEPIIRNGRPLVKNQPGPLKRGDVTLSTWLYHRGREATPNLNSAIASAVSQEVMADLKTKVAYDSDGEADYAWQAILQYERQPPTYRSRIIPVANKTVKLSWDSECVIDFPLFSQQDDSGYPRRLEVALKVGQLTRGQKRWIHWIISKKAKLSDSQLVRKNGKWYLHAVILHDANESRLDATREAVLTATYDKTKPRPFALALPGGPTIGMGFGVPLLRVTERINARRSAIRYASRNGVGSGRGKKRFYSILRPMNQKIDQYKDAMACDMANKLAQVCQRNDIGKVIYREPSRFMRRKTWFELQGVTLNWERVLTRLKSRCLREGIQLVVEQYKKEHADAEVLANATASEGAKEVTSVG